MDINRFLKIFAVLLLMTIYFFAFSHFGTAVFHSWFGSGKAFAEGTYIGPVNVSGKTNGEAEKLLKDKIAVTSTKGSIALQYTEKEVTLPLTMFDYDVEASVEKARAGEKNELVTTTGKEASAQITYDFRELDWQGIDREQLERALAEKAGELPKSAETVKIGSYFIADSNREKEAARAAIQTTVTPGVEELVRKHPAIEIGPKSRWSLIEFVEQQQFTSATADDLSMLGSLLFRLILTTNFELIERHQSISLPAGVDLGNEAAVMKEANKDFIFVNPNEESYRIELELSPGGLTASLKGMPFAYEYEGELTNKQEFPPRTIKMYNPTMPVGLISVSEEGENGQSIEIYRNMLDQDGVVIQQEKIAEDFYPPTHRVEMHSSKQLPPVEPPAESSPPVQTNPDTGNSDSSSARPDENTDNGSSQGNSSSTPEEDDGSNSAGGKGETGETSETDMWEDYGK